MTDEKSWQGFTHAIRELAEKVRAGAVDHHHVAETLRDCAGAIEDMQRRIDLSDAWIAGTGRFSEFDKLVEELQRKNHG